MTNDSILDQVFAPGISKSDRVVELPDLEDPVGSQERISAQTKEVKSMALDAASSGDQSLLDQVFAAEETLNIEQRLLDSATKPRGDLVEQELPEGVNFSGGEFKDFSARFDLAFSKKFSEKEKKFKALYPEGDMIRVRPGIEKETILVRTNPREEYVELDSPSFTYMDFSEAIPALPNMAVSIALAGKGKLGKEMLKQFFGEFSVESFKETIESIRGFQDQTAVDVGIEAGLSGTAAASGEVVGGALTKAKDVATGRGLSKVSTPGKKALEAQKKLDLPELGTDQVAQSKIVQVMGKQARSLNGSMVEHTEAQQSSAFNMLKAMRDKDAEKLLGDELSKMHDEIIKDISSRIRSVEGDLTSLGDGSVEAIAGYEALSRLIVDLEYAKARKAGVVTYDVQGVKEAFSTPKIRTYAAKLPDPEGEGVEILKLGQIPELIAGLSNEFKSIDWTKEITEYKGVQYTQTDWLRYFNKRLFHLANMDTIGLDNTAREAVFEARRIRGVINKTLKEPITGDLAVAELYTKANKEAAKRFTTLEQPIIKQALNTQTPTDFARNFIKKGNYDTLLFIKETLETTAQKASQKSLDDRGLTTSWKQLQDAYISEITSETSETNIMNLPEVLAGRSQKELDLLVPKADQVILKGMAKDIKRARLLDLEGITIRQSKNRMQIAEIIDNRNSAAIDLIAERVSKNPDSPASKSVRAATLDYIFERSTQINSDGIEVIFPDRLSNLLSELQENGTLRHLPVSDIETLKHLENYVRVLGGSGDAGTSLMAAQAVANIREVFSPGKAGGKGVLTWVETYTTGRVLMSPVFRKFILGDPTKKPLDGRATRALTAQVLADIVRDLQQEGNDTGVLQNN